MLVMAERNGQYRYMQLAEQLRGQIQAGEMPPGAPVPSEAELAGAYGISRTSVRNALDLLRQWGLVRTTKGSGTFVRETRQPVIRKNPERYQWEKDRVRLPEYERWSEGVSEHDTGLPRERFRFWAQYDEFAAPSDIARVFGVPEGTRLLRRVYRTSDRNAEGLPIGTGASYLIYDMVAANPDLLDASKEPWPGGTQHQLYTIGIELDRIVDEVMTRPPSPEEADALGIDARGTSVFVLRKISIDITDRVVEVNHIVMPGDSTKLVYVSKLDKWQ